MTTIVLLKSYLIKKKLYLKMMLKTLCYLLKVKKIKNNTMSKYKILKVILIKIKKNGKTFFFIDKLEFKPKLTSVYVKEFNNTGIYKYQQENAKKVIAESNQTTELGKFFIGKYSIKTDKTIEDSIHNGTLTGKI